MKIGKIFTKAHTYLTDEDYRFKVNSRLRGYRGLDDETFLRKKYKMRLNRELNLETPVTFNEKMQWLKLYDRKPEYVRMVDKYEAKGYVADKIGSEYIIPTLAVWDDIDEIDFANLPKQFVLKCTHDSGGLVICKDKSVLDISAAKTKIRKSLKQDFYLVGREWPYKNVKKRIIAEQYMVDVATNALPDYKFFCFHGEPKITLVCSERFSDSGLHEDFFDDNWEHLPVKRPGIPNATSIIEKPKNFELMKNLARTLSENIPFVRIDFYEINGKVYFGEITFYPASGFAAFEPEEWDWTLGDWIQLPK